MRTEKKVQNLSTPCLVRIRTNLRKILRLEIEKHTEYLHSLSSKAISRGDWGSNKTLIRECDEFRELHYRTPISCALCNDFEANLVYEPKRKTWFCVTCYTDAHNLYPDEYP
ncbi:MAG: hypothetical protein ACTSP9_17405 [Promethearchaeota archaeon]